MNIHDVYRPFSRYFRKRRMRRFWQDFQPTSETRILDVGGGTFNWQFLPEQPDLMMLNTRMPGRDDTAQIWVIADGCYQPFIDQAFDIVYSNFVWGWIARPTQLTADSFLREVRLIDIDELQELFPNADIWQERVLGWGKSLIAVRQK